LFINQEYIEGLLHNAESIPEADISKILDKAERMEGLSPQEVAALLVNDNPHNLRRIFLIADELKRRIYGNRIVMFAPVYVSDYCVNRCAYCSYNESHAFARRRLTMDELRDEVRELERMGHKRLALEAGEHEAMCPIDYILACIETIYDMRFENGEIRRVNVNIAATTEENYKKLKDARIGTYILFQETYCRKAYERLHISGPKSDYEYHLTAFDRAMKAGIDDVGGGVLFGLADPYFEVLGLMLHNEHLEKEFGVGFHTISVPRLRPAAGMDIADFTNLVDNETFEKIVAVIRLAVPFTGMILSTRENREMRGRLLKAGISQLSAGSCAEVGGYAQRGKSGGSNPQFTVNDDRDALSVVSGLIDDGYIPSFCTACYRSGRTGDRFMRLAKSGQIKNVCLPNALMTLCEYSMDYGGESFRRKADGAIRREIRCIENENIRLKTEQSLDKIRGGERDLFI